MTSICPNGHTSTADDYCDVCGAPIEAGAQGAAPEAQSAAAPAGGGTATGPAAPAGALCPNCGTENVPDALFCEACGYDFTTGTMPRSASPLLPPDGLAAPEAPAPEAGAGNPVPLTPPDASAGDAAAGGSTGDATGGSTGGDLNLAASTAGTTPPQISSPLDFGWVAEVWIDPAWYEAQESPDSIPSAGLPAIVPLRNKSILIGRKSKSRNINPDIDCEPDTGTSRRQAQLTTDGTRWWVEDLESSNGTFVGAASEPLPEDPIPVGPKHELKPDDRI
ncbi:MAG: zinc-ribbon domain-containing protein, partial [Propionibacteriaceae bacterium]